MRSWFYAYDAWSCREMKNKIGQDICSEMLGYPDTNFQRFLGQISLNFLTNYNPVGAILGSAGKVLCQLAFIDYLKNYAKMFVSQPLVSLWEFKSFNIENLI